MCICEKTRAHIHILGRIVHIEVNWGVLRVYVCALHANTKRASDQSASQQGPHALGTVAVRAAAYVWICKCVMCV